MSAFAIGWVLRHSKAKGAARMVLVVLADHASSDGTNSWPCVRTIQHEACLDSRRTVQKALRTLEQDGAIIAVAQGREGQTNWTVLMANENSDEGGAHLVRGGGVPGGRNPEHEGGVLRTPKPTEEPKEEPTTDDLDLDDAPAQTEMLPDPVIETWEVYVKALDRPRAQLTPKHRKWISDAHSAVGVEQTRDAIRGLAASEYHRENGYVGIEYAIVAKRGQTIESRVEQMAAKAPAADGPTAGRQAIARFSPDTQERIYRAANQIRSWLLNQENRGLASAADGSRRHLERMGLRVVFDDNHSFVRFEEIAK